MPLHGKIVVIKRSGGDGTEFPLTASCLFGRKMDCDIRIQLPQVSKEHCKIDLNENKEVMLSNLSLVNPTRINGEAVKQAQRLKHGDVITIIDRSFRFEYPPAPTPKKKRSSLADKSETPQIVSDQQVANPVTSVKREKRKSSVPTDSSCLKDGSNTSNVQALAAEDQEDVAKEEDQGKPADKEGRSPFCELYQMVKHNLSVKSPWKPAEVAENGSTPSRRESAKTPEVKTVAEKSVEPTSQVDQSTPLLEKMTHKKRRSSSGRVEPRDGKPVESGLGCVATPNSTKRRSQVNTVLSREVSAVSVFPAEEQAEDSSKPVATPSKLAEQSRRSLVTPAKEAVPEEGTPASQKKSRQGTPQKFSASEVLRRVISEDGAAVEMIRCPVKTPKRRRSVGSAGTPVTPATCLSPVGHNVPASTKAQCEPDAEISEAVQKGKSPKAKESASPLRVSPRKSPGKKIQASDSLLELELAAPPCGETSANAGTSTSSGKKRKSEKLESTLHGTQLKKKRVSFGGQLSPELFDKRLPPDSPLRKGGTPGRRSLSFLRRSLLRRSSTGGLIELLQFEQSSPKRKTLQTSPGRKSSPKSASPAKRSPKAKNPSPKAKSSSAKKSEVLSQRSPKVSPKGKQSPSTEDPEMRKSMKSVSPSTKTPKSPSSGTTPVRPDGRLKKSPSTKSPPQAVLTDVGQSTPVATAHHRKSGSDASRTSPGQSTAKKPNAPPPDEVASASIVKTPAPSGRPFNEGSLNQTPTVKGRFSISHVSTPSPVAGQDEDVVEAPACVTPRIPLRRKSMKSTSKKTPRSARKSVLEVIRSRRSGASRANLKVVSSWADIVKFGVSKPQTVTTTKKCTRTAIKRTVIKKPKTPAQKFKDSFSTGHAASPPTIVVGKAQRKMAQAGCPPKIVYNVALMQRNMKINEDLTGIAEMFCTPAKELKDASDCVNPDTPQAADASSTEFSVMNTPEEMGEMVVSPLGVISSEKCRMYDKEAIAWLLKEDQNSSLNDDAVQESDSLTPLVTDESEQDLASKQGMRTPRQKSEPQSGLTGVKRLMKTPKQKVEQVEDLCGIKRLLKTPREPKTSHEVSLVGVKDLMKTPKLKTSPLVCTTGVKRLMRTPKQKGVPVEDMFGVEQLMQTPELKVEPVESLTRVKLLKTPKKKGEPIEHLTGVEQLENPNQKHEQVEDMIEGNQLAQTPVQKAEPVEDVTPVKHLKTLKQKGEPIEHLTGVEQLKTPNQMHVEDMIEGKQLAQAPLEKVEQVEGISEKQLKTIKQKVDPIEDVTGVEQLQIPEQEVMAVEDMTEIKEFDLPKQIEEPIEDITSVEQLKTPKQITESVEDVVRGKEMMEPPVEILESVEDLAALKQLKSSGQMVEPGEVTVKERLKTLEPEVVPAEDMASVKQLKSSGQNVEPNEDFTGLKQLMKTPKQKGEPVEDMTGVSRLMQTPKQKIECVEDLRGVKHLMKTPKQKGEPVEDIIGLKRLMQTPKQKFEPVEDLTGVKQIMKTPKQKGQQVESNFGIREMMKSPRQRGLPVEDFVGLQEMMEEPSDCFPPEESVKAYEATEKVSSPEREESAPVPVTEMSSTVPYELTQPVYQSNSISKSVRGRLGKQLKKIPGDDRLDDGDQNIPEVKAKQSGQSCERAAPVKRTRKKITELDEEPIHSTVAAPARSSRRGTKNVESLTVATEGKLCENMEPVNEGDEVKSSEIAIGDIVENPAVNLVSTKGRRGKGKKEIPQNDSPATPVRRNGRGKNANKTDGASEVNEVSGIEMLPVPEQIEDAPETATVTVPIMESRKGRRLKPVHSEERVRVPQITESIVTNAEQSGMGRSLPEHEEEAPLKSGRARTAKAVMKKDQAVLEVLPKRMRRDAVDGFSLQVVASPVPPLKCGRGRGRKAQVLQNSEETVPVLVDVSSAECSTKSSKKVRGMRSQAKSFDPVAPAASSVPLSGRGRGRRAQILENTDETVPVHADVSSTESSTESPKKVRGMRGQAKRSDSVAPPAVIVPFSGRGRGRRAQILENTEETVPVHADVSFTECPTESPKKGRGMRNQAKRSDSVAPAAVIVPLSGRGRGRKAQILENTEETVPVLAEVSSTECSTKPPKKVRGTSSQAKSSDPVAPVPHIVPLSGRGRGRKAQVLENTDETVPVLADVSSTESSTESPKKVRGMRGQAKSSDPVAPAESTVPLSGRGRGRRAQILENTEETVPVHADASSTECPTESPKKVKGMRGQAKRSAQVAPAQSVVPVSGRGRGRKAQVLENTEETVPVIADVSSTECSTKSSKKVRGMKSQAKSSEPVAEETKISLEQPNNSRRGRAGKKSSPQPTESAPNSENCDLEQCVGPTRSMRKERTEAGPKPDSVKDGIAKAGTKRKLADVATDQVTKHNDDLNGCVNLHSLPKRARAAKVEEAKSEDKLNKTKKGAAKMSGKILDHEMKEIEPIVKTPKPARRGRRNVAQTEVKPVEVQEECPTTRKVGGAKLAATRGRAKAETKMESARSREARPVRHTRQK